MKKIIILFFGILLIFNCAESPEKILEKSNKYVENSEYEKAILSFQKVIDNFPEDSIAQQAKYNLAWLELDKNLEYEKGYKILKKLVDNYPDLEVGLAAKQDLDNFPQWLFKKTNELRSDSTLNKAFSTVDYLITNFDEDPLIPEALYLKGNIYLNDSKEFYRAINTYQEIVYKFKGSQYEPMSKFMIGYIYANVQNDIKKAETTYQEFLQDYPEHELSPSVQFELEYLGKQIQDIEDLKARNN